MPKYLVEVPHEGGMLACAQAVKTFLETGSKFFNEADWGCPGGVHTAWIRIDLDKKEDVQFILPPAYRAQAKITETRKFDLQEINAMLTKHSKKG